MSKGRSSIVARALIGQYDISSITDSKEKIVDFYRYAMENAGVTIKEGDHLSVKRETRARANELAEQLAARVSYRDPDAEEAYKDIRAMMSGKFYLSQQDRSNIADFSAYARSRDNLIKLTTDRDAMSINQAYTELQSVFPQYFNDGPTNPADQLVRINEVMRSLRNSSIPLPASDRAALKDDLAFDLIRSYAGMLRAGMIGGRSRA